MDHSLDQEIVPVSGHAEFPPARTPHVTRPAAGQGRVYWIWAICGFLVLAVGLVFGQTVRHEFLAYDDQAYVYENPHVTPGFTLPGIWWG